MVQPYGLKLPSGANSHPASFHFYHGRKRLGTKNTMTGFTWYPSSKAREPLDEMQVFEGHVTPDDSITEPRPSKILLFLPALVREYKMP